MLISFEENLFYELKQVDKMMKVFSRNLKEKILIREEAREI